jgi:hypothetical protein
MACVTCFDDALCQSASTCRWSCGITDCAVSPVRISLPPMMRGISIRSFAISLSRSLSAFFSGEPGA